ncbi:unnamed protein product [Symbiodinium sp. CCMP2456]|nr:unnamed protein product [Symbiodinium sp. CCMP2456]
MESYLGRCTSISHICKAVPQPRCWATAPKCTREQGITGCPIIDHTEQNIPRSLRQGKLPRCIAFKLVGGPPQTSKRAGKGRVLQSSHFSRLLIELLEFRHQDAALVD